MTDNEFLKAIKWCSTQDHCNTSVCPIYRDMGDDEDCATKICKYTLDLIERKDAEISHKDAIIKAVLDTVHDLGDDLARALEKPNTTKHSKWKINCDGYYPYCPECGAEPKGGIMTKYCAECGTLMEGVE